MKWITAYVSKSAGVECGAVGLDRRLEGYNETAVSAGLCAMLVPLAHHSRPDKLAFSN